MSSKWIFGLVVVAIGSYGCYSNHSSGTSADASVDAQAIHDIGVEMDGAPGTDLSIEVDHSLMEVDALIDADIPTEDASTLEMSDAGPRGAQLTLSNTPAECDPVGVVAPSLPAEAGHYAASILTPSSYPFAIEAIQYTVLQSDDTPTCNGSLGHRVQLFAIEGGPLPENPAATGLGYRSYDVPETPNTEEGRQIEITVPIPLILTEGQRAVVAVQFATQGDQHLCVANCILESPDRGLDWWSNAAEVPFRWQDLVADFGFRGLLMTRLLGVVIR